MLRKKHATAAGGVSTGRISRRLDDRLTGQIIILQQRQPPAISLPRQPLHLPRRHPIGVP